MGRGVGIGAAEKDAGLRDALLGRDHMEDALVRIVKAEIAYADLGGVLLHQFEHAANFVVLDAGNAAIGGLGRHFERQVLGGIESRLVCQRQIVRWSACGEGERMGGSGHGALGVCAAQAPAREVRRRLRLVASPDSTTLFTGGATTENRFGKGSL